MKCDRAKLSRHKGNQIGGETGPLFPPLHVSDTGKAGLRAPPRNKMALFEQFTVSCNSYLPPNKLAAAECASRQQDTSGFLNTYTNYFMPATPCPAGISNKGVTSMGKSSHGSSLGSVSNCSAVVNVDESQRFQEAELGDDMCLLVPSKLETVPGKDGGSSDKVSKDRLQDSNLTMGMCLSPHVAFKGESCGQAVGAMLEDSLTFNQGLSVGENVNAEYLSAMERSYQAAESNDVLTSAACSHLSGDSRLMVKKDTSKGVQVKALTQPKTGGQFITRSCANPLEKPGVSSHCDDALVSPGETARSPLFIIKPKDVIHAVGQQLFWKARKAILRQQEVFSKQVFELHKLIEVQKSLAKMPSTLIEEHLVSRITSGMAGGDFYPVKINCKKLEIISKEAQQAPASNKSEGHEGHGSRRKTRSQAIEENGGRVVGASSKRQSSSSDLPQALTNAPFGSTPHSSSCDHTSAWGYPLAPLNRPFLSPPGVGHFPLGSGFGAAYAVNTSPPMASFTFPCYTQRPEQPPALVFCPTNQWSNPMYHNPFLAPMANDWFAMNHPSPIPLNSGNERPGPANSVPSINMRAEASSQSIQPAIVPLSRRQQVEKIKHTKVAATKCSGSMATVSVSTAPDALSGKPDQGNKAERNPASNRGNMGEHNPALNPGAGIRFMPSKVWGSFGGDQTRAAVKVSGHSKDTKERAQMSLCSREDGMAGNDPLLEKNALNLFPLQPSSSSEGQAWRGGEGSYGRVIKAIPRSALAASQSAAGILLSIQRERQL